MTEKELIQKNPFLYHLTDARNISRILQDGEIWSTERLITEFDPENLKVIGTKRNDHYVVTVDDDEIYIRDQKPISEVVLARSLTDDWTSERFIRTLNNRVFFWPNINRLTRHYRRYVHENPIILRVDTADLLAVNERIEVSRLNTGATRCHPAYGGNAPTRGKDTFLAIGSAEYAAREVAEVTIPDSCALPNNVMLSDNPGGPWSKFK